MSKNLENLLKLEVWLIMKAVPLKDLPPKGRGHTVEGVMPQEAGRRWVSWLGRGTLLSSHIPAPGIERFSSSHSHPEETKGKGRKTSQSQIYRK